MTTNLGKLGVKHDLKDFDFRELIKNSYDSAAMRGFQKGEELILSMVIKEKNGVIIVKLKDNGMGFPNKPHSFYFDRESFKPVEKDRHLGLLGGNKIGLSTFENYLGVDGEGTMVLKNRKNHGAAVYLFFNKEGRENPIYLANRLNQQKEQEREEGVVGMLAEAKIG